MYSKVLLPDIGDWYLDHISLNIYISGSSGPLPCRQELRLGPASRRVAWAQPSEDGMIHFTDSMALRIRQVSATGNCTVSPATWSDHDRISTASTLRSTNHSFTYADVTRGWYSASQNSYDFAALTLLRFPSHQRVRVLRGELSKRLSQLSINFQCYLDLRKWINSEGYFGPVGYDTYHSVQSFVVGSSCHTVKASALNWSMIVGRWNMCVRTVTIVKPSCSNRRTVNVAWCWTYSHLNFWTLCWWSKRCGHSLF